MHAQYFMDRLIQHFDAALKTVFPPQQRAAQRASPGDAILETPSLSPEEKKHIAGLMRVNHAGEVCAQALYQGQAFTAKLTHIKAQMMQAAEDEVDHLAWCEQRLAELGSHTSVLNVLWYAGSLMLGAIAGLAGDAISLGFVAETERQVGAHLQAHLDKIPPEDVKSLAILTQMKIDETRHAEEALRAGGMILPLIVQQMMRLTAKVMTKTSYYF